MFKYLVAGITVAVLTACSSYHLPDSPTLSTEKQWVIMPFSNFSGSAFASEQAEDIAVSVLKEEDVNVKLYQVTGINALDTILDPSIKLKAAQKWLANQGADYILSASVSEWRYKSGVDAEPAVGITLKVIDATTNEVLWQGTGARSGWGRENLAQTGMEVISEIIEELDLN